MKRFKFTKEGLPITSSYFDFDDKRVAAMGAAILSVSERYVEEYTLGNLKRISIHAGDEILVLSKIGENGVLSIWKKDYSRLSVMEISHE